MSEFVEESLEKLLPVYELLQNTELFTPKEVNEFVKRCRNYEYRLQKTIKDPDDFLLYADYLKDALELIRIRRRKLKYFLKRMEIDDAVKSKIADIYKWCSLRFQGRKDVWRNWLDFLKKENMRVRCSKAFFRALQVHGSDTHLREEAARWEFKKNMSIDNARLHLQFALRSTPGIASLWITFFEIEILNAERLINRRNVLLGKEGKKEEEAHNPKELAEEETAADFAVGTSDAVLDFKLAEIVASQALECPDVLDKHRLLYDLWRCAKRCGSMASKLEESLFNRLWEQQNLCEESWIAKFERNSDEEDMYQLFDDACMQFDTEKMLRYYIEMCEKQVLIEDAFASVKLRELLQRLHQKGYAHLSDYNKMLKMEGDDVKKIALLESAVDRIPSAASLWASLIRLKIDNSASEKDIQNLFNKAEQSVKGEDALEIYQLAIDWTIANAPSKVNAVFERAILVTPPDVSSEIKCIRLRFLKAANPSNPSIYRIEYAKMCSRPPNTMKFHKTFIELEKETNDAKGELIVRAMENCLADFGSKHYECWIDYAKYLMDHDPCSLSKLYERAVASVPAAQLEAFNVEWTRMSQNAVKLGGNKRGMKKKRKPRSGKDSVDRVVIIS